MAYKPYKMKGHTLPGINQRSEGDTDLPDGRSGSSPLQDIKTWTAKEMNDGTGSWVLKDQHNKAHKKEGKEKSSPAKCPFLAALPMITQVAGAVGAVGGAAKAMKKEK